MLYAASSFFAPRTSKSRMAFVPAILITGAGHVLRLEVAYAEAQADAWNDVSGFIPGCKPGHSGVHVSLPILHAKIDRQISCLSGRL